MIGYQELSRDKLEKEINNLLLLIPLSSFNDNLFNKLTILLTFFCNKFVNDKILNIVCYKFTQDTEFIIRFVIQFSQESTGYSTFQYNEYHAFCQQIYQFMEIPDAKFA